MDWFHQQWCFQALWCSLWCMEREPAKQTDVWMFGHLALVSKILWSWFSLLFDTHVFILLPPCWNKPRNLPRLQPPDMWASHLYTASWTWQARWQEHSLPWVHCQVVWMMAVFQVFQHVCFPWTGNPCLAIWMKPEKKLQRAYVSSQFAFCCAIPGWFVAAGGPNTRQRRFCAWQRIPVNWGSSWGVKVLMFLRWFDLKWIYNMDKCWPGWPWEFFIIKILIGKKFLELGTISKNSMAIPPPGTVAWRQWIQWIEFGCKMM